MKQKRVSRPTVLRAATPYPWKRNYKGDLSGRNGRPVYFRGVDAVLIEHSPEMAEALVVIHALSERRKDSRCTLNLIRSLASQLLARLEKATGRPSWCKGSIS